MSEIIRTLKSFKDAGREIMEEIYITRDSKGEMEPHITLPFCTQGTDIFHIKRSKSGKITIARGNYIEDKFIVSDIIKGKIPDRGFYQENESSCEIYNRREGWRGEGWEYNSKGGFINLNSLKIYNFNNSFVFEEAPKGTYFGFNMGGDPRQDRKCYGLMFNNEIRERVLSTTLCRQLRDGIEFDYNNNIRYNAVGFIADKDGILREVPICRIREYEYISETSRPVKTEYRIPDMDDVGKKALMLEKDRNDIIVTSGKVQNNGTITKIDGKIFKQTIQLPQEKRFTNIDEKLPVQYRDVSYKSYNTNDGGPLVWLDNNGKLSVVELKEHLMKTQYQRANMEMNFVKIRYEKNAGNFSVEYSRLNPYSKNNEQEVIKTFDFGDEKRNFLMSLLDD